MHTLCYLSFLFFSIIYSLKPSKLLQFSLLLLHIFQNELIIHCRPLQHLTQILPTMNDDQDVLHWGEMERGSSFVWVSPSNWVPVFSSHFSKLCMIFLFTFLCLKVVMRNFVASWPVLCSVWFCFVWYMVAIKILIDILPKNGTSLFV